MQARVWFTSDRLSSRSLAQFLLVAAVALLFLQSTAAQTTPTPPAAAVVLPKPIVLVLKLVSANYVKPTTGIVISDDGLVLVPAGFVAAGDEIVVMDGGTDIARNGRPSRPVKRSVTDGLAVLSVEGLARPGIILSEDRLLPANVYHLAAFPAAEKIAQGAQPLWLPVRLEKRAANGRFSISADTPLPNTTGAVIDDCGYLVGLSLAVDGQDQAVDKKPVAVLGDDLSLLLDAMQIDLKRAICKQPDTTLASQEKPVATEVPTAPEQGPVDATAAPDEAPADELSVDSDLDKSAAALPPATGNSAASVWATIPWWLWVTTTAIALALLLTFIFFLRQGRHKPSPDGQRQAAVDTHPPRDEPDTAPLGEDADVTPRSPANRTPAEDEIPDPDALPDGYDGLVVIDGWLGDGTGFKRYCMVNVEHIDVLIGRGDAALAIETPAISRRHIRLEKAGESLTVSDLGSSNGTFIRGIPCLPGEVMFIEQEDEIQLGDVRFHITVLRGAKP